MRSRWTAWTGSCVPSGSPLPRSLPTWTRASAPPSCDPAPGSGMPFAIPGGRDQDHPAQPVAAHLAGPTKRATGGPPDRLDRGTGLGTLQPALRRFPSSRPRAGGTGPARWPRTSTHLFCSATRRCRRWPQWWTAPAGRCSGCRSATRIRLAGSGCSSMRASAGPVRPRPVERPGPGLDQPPPTRICLPARYRKSAGQAWPKLPGPGGRLHTRSDAGLRRRPDLRRSPSVERGSGRTGPAGRAGRNLPLHLQLPRAAGGHARPCLVGAERRRQGDRRRTPSNFGSDAWAARPPSPPRDP